MATAFFARGSLSPSTCFFLLFFVSLSSLLLFYFFVVVFVSATGLGWLGSGWLLQVHRGGVDVFRSSLRRLGLPRAQALPNPPARALRLGVYAP